MLYVSNAQLQACTLQAPPLKDTNWIFYDFERILCTRDEIVCDPDFTIALVIFNICL